MKEEGSNSHEEQNHMKYDENLIATSENGRLSMCSGPLQAPHPQTVRSAVSPPLRYSKYSVAPF